MVFVYRRPIVPPVRGYEPQPVWAPSGTAVTAKAVRLKELVRKALRYLLLAEALSW